MPANPLIPRDTIHRWSEEIGERATEHSAALQRLLKDQRRLTRFIEKNKESLAGASGGICVYLTGVIARMFDMAGGRLRNATWADIHAAEQRVAQHIDTLLPLDDALLERFHAIDDRAQAHILDEAAMTLFAGKRPEGEEELAQAESFKVLLVCWVVTEVLDANWRPPANFEGERTYTYVHIEPKKPEPAAADAEAQGAK